MIQKFSHEYPVRLLCRMLEVQPSGYYQWRRKVPGPRVCANRQLLEQIRMVFAQSRQTYGSPRVTHELRRQKVRCSVNRVARLMRRHQLRAKAKSPFRPRTTESRHSYSPAPNRLARQGPPAQPDQAWAADITYLWTTEGWVYLAAVMDLCSRKIVGWSVRPSLHTTLVREALQQAWLLRRPAAGLLHHSDRGCQYASSAFQALLQHYQIVPSMSAAGHCYDNAAMESFWSTLKAELIHRITLRDLSHSRLVLFEYIELFYNRQRLHSALGFKSPVEFEESLTYK
jgi:transposase InsO family protein